MISCEMSKPVIAIHGGAGTISRANLSKSVEAEIREALTLSLRRGSAVLESGGSAVDAVQLAVEVLEDCPLFNAGRGSVFAHGGTNEMDASIMDGATQKAGAVAGVRFVRNPVACARLVMDKSAHVFLAGAGAEEFASEQGLPLESPEYFFSQLRWDQLQEIVETEKTQLDHSKGKIGTVGAVALDSHGNLAAATSTGGMTNKRYGRVGDSPIIGCGTYANHVCAVSCTGHGEYFIRAVAAHSVAMAVELGGRTIGDAADHVVHSKIARLGGDGGLIAIDKDGSVAMPFNTEGMYRGCLRSGEECQVFIFR
jgi:beta-aspartyl-peptidase (threonine type)